MADFNSVTTRGGDKGESSLLSGERRRKDDLIFETLGDLDELSSAIGLARAALDSDPIGDILLAIQKKLLLAGAMLASFPKTPDAKYCLTTKDLEDLEKQEQELLRQVPPLQGFVFPGSSEQGARIDLARSVCRRCERRIVSCIRDKGYGEAIIIQKYINRLSDFLFISARFVEM